MAKMTSDGFNKKKEVQNISFADFGKLPPQAIDLEEAIIGALIIDDTAISRIAETMSADKFYKNDHQKIYEAIYELSRIGGAIDGLTVIEQLKKNGTLEEAGGAYNIAQLSNKISTSANIEYHAQIVLQKYLQRKVIQLSSDAIRKAYEDSTDIYEIVDEMADNLREVNNALLQDNKETWKEATENYVMDIIEKVNSGVKHTGIRIGLDEVDETVAGFRDGLYILAGRPSMGKSALGFEMACRIAEQKTGKVGIFSLEMSRTQLINRIVSRYSRINQTRLINADIDKSEVDQLMKGGGTASTLDFLINDKSTISIEQIRSKAKVWASKNKISAIVVDYVQLVKGKSQNRVIEIGEISKGLKGLSKDLGIPVIALAQLGREKDAGKTMPRMSELRESGDLEQDADCVMLLYRPEYYGIEQDVEGKSTRGLTKVIIAKNRNGAINLNGANIRSNLAINRYENWENEIGMPAAQQAPEKSIQVTGKEEDFIPF